MKARLIDGKIVELFAGDPTGKFHPDIIAMLVDVPESAEIGWVQAQGVWGPEPPQPLTSDDYAAAIEGHVSAVATSRGYAGPDRLASYVTSTVPGWAAEAQAFVAWRDVVWLAAYQTFKAVQDGQIEPPTIENLIQGLPAITWPGD